MDLNIEQLNILRDWPTDSAIRGCFKNSFSIAEELCEALGINVLSENNLNLPYVKLVILIQNWTDNDISMNSRMITSDLDENSHLKENDISTAINIASKQAGSLSSLDNDDILELDTNDLIKQVDLIQNTQSCLSLVNNGILIYQIFLFYINNL